MAATAPNAIHKPRLLFAGFAATGALTATGVYICCGAATGTATGAYPAWGCAAGCAATLTGEYPACGGGTGEAEMAAVAEIGGAAAGTAISGTGAYLACCAPGAAC